MNKSDNGIRQVSPQSAERRTVEAVFDSPVQTSIDELVGLRLQAQALNRVHKRRVKEQVVGASASRALGRGLDFSEVRSYQPGDDVRMIDWNVTARTGIAHTKLFVEERERPFFMMVDLCESMRFATRGMFKSVLAARLAAILGWGAVAGNDRVGGLVYTDNAHVEIKPQTGRLGLMAVFRAIDNALRESAHGQSDVSGNTGQQLPASVNLENQLKRLRRLAHSGSGVCLLSDFSAFDSRCESSTALLQQHVQLTSVHITDPLEENLPPPGLYPISCAGSRMTLLSGSGKHREQYQRDFAQRNEELKRHLSARRSRYLPISTATNFVDAASMLQGASS